VDNTGVCGRAAPDVQLWYLLR